MATGRRHDDRVHRGAGRPIHLRRRCVQGRGSWPYPNGNLANTRVASNSSISIANVHTLRKAWTFRITGKAAKSLQHYGSLAATPVVVDGVVYIQDLYSNVYALSLANGALKWKYEVNKAVLSGPGPNGVAVAEGRVYGFTPTRAFALNAVNGKVVWVDKHLLKKGQGTFGIQPTVANGAISARASTVTRPAAASCWPSTRRMATCSGPSIR